VLNEGFLPQMRKRQELASGWAQQLLELDRIIQ